MSGFRAPPGRSDRVQVAPRAGLCATCRHLQVLRSARSVFVRCARSDQDGDFPRYPCLPVLSCRGHEAVAAEAGGASVDTPGARR